MEVNADFGSDMFKCAVAGPSLTPYACLPCRTLLQWCAVSSPRGVPAAAEQGAAPGGGRNYAPEVSFLLEAGLPVLIYAGVEDLICNDLVSPQLWRAFVFEGRNTPPTHLTPHLFSDTQQCRHASVQCLAAKILVRQVQCCNCNRVKTCGRRRYLGAGEMISMQLVACCGGWTTRLPGPSRQ